MAVYFGQELKSIFILTALENLLPGRIYFSRNVLTLLYMSERTLVILKPDTLQRSLMGEIVNRFERTGLKMVAAKMLHPSVAQLEEHYAKDDEWYLKKGVNRVKMLKGAGKAIDENRPAIEYGKDIIRGIIRYMGTNPVLAMVWEGNQSVAVIKKLVGTTDPTASDVGTIRGDYQLDSYSLSDSEQRAIRNLVHCSDSPQDAEREVKVWFVPAELHDYVHVNEAILQDVNLDGSKE